MPWIPCQDCGEQIVVRGPGVYKCPECGRKNRHQADDEPEEGESTRRPRQDAAPWYVNCVSYCCYTHLIFMVIFTPIALIGELVFALATIGIGLPILIGHLVALPLTILPGLLPLLLVDIWKAQIERGSPAS